MTGPIAGLGNYFGKSPLSSGPGASDIAKFILLNADTSQAMGPGASVNNSPSVLSRLFDILSRPNYAMANTVLGMEQGGDHNPIKDFISGLAGTQKTTFENVLDKAGLPPSTGRAALGFGLDVALDPTTYIPGGQVGKLKNIVKGLKGAGEVSKDLPAVEKVLRGGAQPVNPEHYGLPAVDNQIPSALAAKPTIPNLSDPGILQPKPGFTQPQQALDLQLPDIPSVLGGKVGATKPLTQPRITIPDSIRNTLQGPDSPVDLAKNLDARVKGQISMAFPGMPLKDMKRAAQIKNLDTAPNIVDAVARGDVRKTSELIPLPKPVIKPSHVIEAQRIVDSFNTDAASAKLNKLFPDSLNAKQQVRLWYKAREAVQKSVRRTNPIDKTKRDAAKVESEIVQRTIPIYHAVEQNLISKGKIPRIGTGENVKLSDVIGDLTLHNVPINEEVFREFGSNIQKHSYVGGAIERLRARGAIQDSPKIKDIMDIAREYKTATTATTPMSDYATKNFDHFLKKFTNTLGKSAGVSPAGFRAQSKLINMTLDAGKSRAQIAVQHMSKELDDVIATGKANGRINTTITHALENDLGKLPKWVQNDNKAVEWLMGRVATWWGQSDLRPLSLTAIASSASTATARGRVLNNMFKSFDSAQRLEAFRFAQGLTQPTTQANAHLGADIMRTMDDLIGQAAGSSVLLRSGVHMDQLNKWMKRYNAGFEFKKSQMKSPITGSIQDFSKGSNWVNSWKMADIGKQDPASFMYKTMQALEQATREKSLFDEIGERFGSQVAGKSYVHKIEGHPYLDPYYFPADIAKQIPRVVKDWTDVGSHTQNDMLKLYDRILSMWKSSATIYRPGFHVRNLVGDVYMGMLDGVVSVRPYKYALQVQRSMHGAYDSMMDIDKMVEMGIISRGVETPVVGKTLFKNKSGVPFTAEQIAAVAHQQGLLEHYRTIEDIIDIGGEQKGFGLTRPFAGKVQRFAGGAAELETHNARLAHFIDKVIKSRGSNLQEIFTQAAQRSRKFHPSGIDMTQFEKNVLRRIIPFYSWLRKSSPVLLEGIVMKPGITVLPAKMGQAMQSMGGVQSPDRSNPFPTDQMFPAWLRNEGIGPVATGDSFLGKLSNQATPGYVQFGTGLNPLSQLLAQFQDPSKTVGSSLTPALQIPMELITGRKIFTGQPITGPDAQPGAFGEYIGSQVPAINAFQGLTGFGLSGQTNKSIKSSGGAQKEALTNWLTGLGIKGTGPYIKEARYEKTQPIKMQQAAAKQDFLAQLRSQMGG